MCSEFYFYLAAFLKMWTEIRNLNIRRTPLSYHLSGGPSGTDPGTPEHFTVPYGHKRFLEWGISESGSTHVRREAANSPFSV